MRTRHRRSTAAARLIVVIAFVLAGIFGSVVVAQVAQISIIQEFIYPTGFDPPQIGGDGRMTPAIPRDFKTREVGVKLSIMAVTVDRPDPAAYVAALREQRAVTGNSELMIAAATGDTATVRRLLDAGTDPNAANRHGSTALMAAAAAGYADIVGALIEKKAEVNARSQNGATALIFAARNGHLGVVQALLKAGARPELSDNDRKTALEYATQNKYVDIAQALTAAGAK